MMRSLFRFLFFLSLLAVLLLTSAPLLPTAKTLAEEAESAGPRVAILHGVYANQYGQNVHHDEFDAAMKSLGWSGSKFASKTEEMDRLMVALDRRDFDLIFVCPLFNYGSENVLDLRSYGPQFRKFVENGGALVFSDALYPENYVWLTSIDPTLKLCSGKCSAARDPENVPPLDATRFLPNEIRETNSWGHLVLPDGHGWKVVARCCEGNPLTVIRRIGKGFVCVSGCRFAGAAFLENYRVNRELAQLGLTAVSFTPPSLEAGRESISITLKNLSENQSSTGTGVLSVTSLKSGDSVSHSNDFQLTPDGESRLEFPGKSVTHGARGPIRVTFSLTSDGQTVRIFDRTFVVPDFLTLRGPAYRGFVVESELKRNGGKAFAFVDLFPMGDLPEKLTFEAVVKSANGQPIGKTTKIAVSERSFRIPLEIGFPAAGSCTLEGKVFLDGRLLETKTAEMTILRDVECPVWINENLNFVTNGKEFFPLGLYHLPPADVEQAADLGFNTVQMMSWFFDDALTVPKKRDLWVLYEQNHRGCGEDWVGKNAAELAQKFKNVLMWYGLDEPDESTFESAQKVHDVYHRFDPGHPTFVVSCKPPLFASQMALGDVFAVDPYPYPSRPIAMTSDWIDQAQEAARGQKPVVCVTQSFGSETPETLRAMAYLAVTHEVRGLFWYPWNDGGTTGLKFHPELHATVKALLTEFRALTPALLNPVNRRQFRSENGLIHGLFCEETPEKRLVLLVNPESTPQTIDLSAFEELKGVKTLKDRFGTDSQPVEKPLELNAYETRTLQLE